MIRTVRYMPRGPSGCATRPKPKVKEGIDVIPLSPPTTAFPMRVVRPIAPVHRISVNV